MMYASFLSRGTSTHRAFTLIELLVAVSIIGLLSSLVLASVNKARDDAKQKTALQFAAQNDRIMGADAVGMWNFEEGSGTTVRDTSGWGNHGTISGATFTTDTYNAGVSKYALSFDGVNDYVWAPSFLLPTPFTFSGWFKATSLPSGWGAVVSNLKHGAPATGANIIPQSQALKICYGNGIAGYSYYTINIPQVLPDVWIYVVGSYDGTYMTVYVNGVQKDKRAVSIMQSSQQIRMGIWASSYSGYFFSGLIDDVRIYTRSLTARETTEQYLAGVEKLYANEIIDEEEYRTRLVAVANESARR